MDGFKTEITPPQFEQLVAFERDGVTPAGGTLSHSLARELGAKGLAARIEGGWVVTLKGQSVLEAWRTTHRNLRVQEVF